MVEAHPDHAVITTENEEVKEARKTTSVYTWGRNISDQLGLNLAAGAQ